jgi:hypothetical protein
VISNRHKRPWEMASSFGTKTVTPRSSPADDALPSG